MANIIFDEKRWVRVGEVCALGLKTIHPIKIYFEDHDCDGVKDAIVFFTDDNENITTEDDVTFVKYIGNGLFMDLVSDQLLMTSTYGSDSIGSDNYDLLDKESQDELDKMSDFYTDINGPQNKEEFKDTFSIFMRNPMLIDMDDYSQLFPIMSIDSEITKKFASQSLEQVKTKILSAKAKAQQSLKEQYSKYEDQIIRIYNAKENAPTPRTL